MHLKDAELTPLHYTSKEDPSRESAGDKKGKKRYAVLQKSAWKRSWLVETNG